MAFCTVSISRHPLPHKTGVARVAAVFGSTSGRLSASANFISSSQSPAAVPGAHHHAVAQSPLIGSALINSVRHPFLDLSVLLNYPLCSLSSPPLTICQSVSLLPSSLGQASGIDRQFSASLLSYIYPLSSSRCPTSVPGLFVSFLAVALLLYASYSLSFSSFSCLFVRSWVRMSSLTAVLLPSSRALFQSIPP
jgi:hypothetical protein